MPDRVIHRTNPFVASRVADRNGRRLARQDPERTLFFAEREVQNPDGTFPFGEGFLYEGIRPRSRRRDPGWAPGEGTPGGVATAGHRGTKPEQQDSMGAWQMEIAGQPVSIGVVADGVSASGRRARRASRTATRVFHEQLKRELVTLSGHEAQRHTQVERAMARAAFAANFEVIRHVLFDTTRDGSFDEVDRARLKKTTGIDLPTGRLSPARMRMLAPKLDEAVGALARRTERSALTTFAVALCVGNDLYTYSVGDAVVGLYRPGIDPGSRYLHLTHRDQSVVEVFLEGGAGWREAEDVWQNEITACLGEDASLPGTVRRYPNLLEPEDRVVVCSDGIGPRAPGRGLGRDGIEAVLDAHPGDDAAEALVEAQLDGLEDGEYQDNIGVAVLRVDPR